jgi:hypothetical protein
MLKEDSICGSLINFRGLVYSPINEQGVVFLFGRVLDDLNMYIEEVRTAYPDCVARRYTGKGWGKVYIEFEYLSSSFIQHGHEPSKCDIIVCWEDDLTESQKKTLEGIEIIELKSRIKEFENPKIEEPDKVIAEKEHYDLDYHLKQIGEKMAGLFVELDKRIKGINPEIWNKPTKYSITYYSPERVFIYAHPQKQRIKLHLFTNAVKIVGVDSPDRNAPKWGRIYLGSREELDNVINVVKKSHELIKYAIKENLNTGWFSTPENIEREESLVGEEQSIQ